MGIARDLELARGDIGVGEGAISGELHALFCSTAVKEALLLYNKELADPQGLRDLIKCRCQHP